MCGTIQSFQTFTARLVTIAGCAAALWLGACATTGQEAADADRTEQREERFRFSKENGPQQIADALYMAGMERDEADAKAREIAREFEGPDHIEFAWEQSNPHAMLLQAFQRAGWETQEAVSLADLALAKFEQGGEPQHNSIKPDSPW